MLPDFINLATNIVLWHPREGAGDQISYKECLECVAKVWNYSYCQEREGKVTSFMYNKTASLTFKIRVCA